MAHTSGPTRRALLATAAAFSPLLKAVELPTLAGQSGLSGLRVPDRVWIELESTVQPLTRSGERWQAAGVELETKHSEQSLALSLTAPAVPLRRIALRWTTPVSSGLQFLGDAWERSYGDLAWRTMEPDRILPWYALVSDGHTTFACGVKTSPAAFCFWQFDPAGIVLWLDVRNGGDGVRLGNRLLPLAEVVSAIYPEGSPFAAACRFCRLLSPQPRLPASPVYGGNNWYYAYGKSSAAAIREDSRRIADLAPSSANRPFMVIDDGWQPNPTAGPWSHGNAAFNSMPQLAADMRKIGVRPGLWMRPLFTKETVPPAWCLRSPNAEAELRRRGASTLDPTVPDVRARLVTDMARAVQWGYELIKHDFSTYDLLGRWGFRMGAELTDSGWTFADRTRTNAEIVRDLYHTLRQAAGNALVLGCNTVGHLSAGIFELSRTGDDTSGRDWNRTRKMGVNTLAFRAPQHGSFYAIDADCVGLTKDIPWPENRQWLDLLARSGTPLFVSAAPDALGPEQRKAVGQAFARAAEPQPLIEPLDWLITTQPQHWQAGRDPVSYDWFTTGTPSPLG